MLTAPLLVASTVAVVPAASTVLPQTTVPQVVPVSAPPVQVSAIPPPLVAVEVSITAPLPASVPPDCVRLDIVVFRFTFRVPPLSATLVGLSPEPALKVTVPLLCVRLVRLYGAANVTVGLLPSKCPLPDPVTPAPAVKLKLPPLKSSVAPLATG